MRLRRLNLDFFGHFAGKSYDFGPVRTGTSDFHIVFGPNEAGKTTTMEAFLRLLYGFPARDPYAFKHQRANLRVSGVLDMNGTEQMFTRLPTKAGNLLNARGEPVPETALHSALSSLTEEDYRKLLCLDDETIEAGGKEIADSKGDIGRLLFGAASGMSDLSAVLGDVDQRAGAFYKKGGSKSEFAQLKRELDDVNGQIKDLDVSALQYRKLRQDVEAAQAREAAARTARKAALDRQTRVSAVITALPLMQHWAELETDLQPLAAYPLSLEVDPEDLVELLMQRGQLIAQKEALSAEIETKLVAREGVSVRPDLVAKLTQLEALREARGRYDTAQIDLPKRRDARETAMAEMGRSVMALGLDPAAGMGQFVLRDADLMELEGLLDALRGAELHAAQAETEVTTAKSRADQAAWEAGAQESIDPKPDLKALLERENAADVFEAFGAARAAIGLSERSARAALGALSHKGQVFDTVPVLEITVAEAAGIVREIAQSEADLAIAIADAADLATRADGFTRQIAVYHTADLITDEAAAETRAEREVLWRAHLSGMGAATAGDFEAAMRSDDHCTSRRQSQAKDLGELRQIKLSLADAQAKNTACEGRLRAAQSRIEAAQARLSTAVTATGLTGPITPDAFVEWVGAAVRAADLARAVIEERAAQSSVIAAAQTLAERLSEALAEPDAGLEALLKIARTAAEAQAAAAFAAASARKASADAARDLVLREAALAGAQSQILSARAAWSAAISQHFGAQINADQMRSAMPGLRGLGAIFERFRAVERQISGMEADQAAFLDALAGIFGTVLEAGAVRSAMEELESAGSAARGAQETWARLSEDIEVAERGVSEAGVALAGLDARVALLSAGFASEIATQTLEDLRMAVSTAQRAIGLRMQSAKIAREICTALGTVDLVEARAELDGKTLDQARADFAEIERDLVSVEAEMTATIEVRTASQVALNAVTGAGDIASRVARKRVIEEQMQAGVMGYLEERLGYMLADRAIRSYRDKHRSGMMKAAESAFCDLTSGAYIGLTTQPEGAAETLVAIQGSDGAAKQAHAMSKGTRFQLYLALRAAAYSQMADNGTVLPFFCDDVFETFDDTRTRAACHLMHRIGQRGQAIYLTHHQHVVDIAREVCGSEVTVHHV